MGLWVLFVAGLVALVKADGGAVPVQAAAPAAPAAAAEPQKMVYYGQFKDSCGSDGLYYNDEVSFVVCDHGTAHVQPCAPGSHNDKMENYKEQDSYAMTSFCGNIYAHAPPMLPNYYPRYHGFLGYHGHHGPYYHGYYHHAAPYYHHGYHHAYPYYQHHNDVDKFAHQKPYQKHAPAQPAYQPAQPAAQPAAPAAKPAAPKPDYKPAAAQPMVHKPAPAQPAVAKPAAGQKY